MMCGTDFRIDSKACLGLSFCLNAMVLVWWCKPIYLGDSFGLRLEEIAESVSFMISGDFLVLDLVRTLAASIKLACDFIVKSVIYYLVCSPGYCTSFVAISVGDLMAGFVVCLIIAGSSTGCF